VKPEGHLLTAAAASAGAYLATGSWEFAAGAFTGGFWIDLDHYVDYVLVERQWSLNPFRFLAYYLGNRARRLVLVLHSYELMAALIVLALFLKNQALVGYILGAAMHMCLDIVYNHDLRHPVRFYSFAYRIAHAFEATHLLRT